MSVYATVTICRAPELTEAKLDQALQRSGFEGNFTDITAYPSEEQGWTIHGSSRFADNEADRLAEVLSAHHPGSRVEVREEWDPRDADNPGKSVRLYVAGEHVVDADRSEGLIPSDLDASLTALREALAGNGDLVRAAEWLADGLDGTRAAAAADPVTVAAVSVVDEWGTDYSAAFAERFDYSPVIVGDRRSLFAAEGDPTQLRTRESLDGIIRAWIASAEAHTPNRYGVEWFESAGAYVIGCWTGESMGMVSIYCDDRDEVSFEALVDTLRLKVTTTWSDNATC